MVLMLMPSIDVIMALMIANERSYTEIIKILLDGGAKAVTPHI